MTATCPSNSRSETVRATAQEAHTGLKPLSVAVELQSADTLHAVLSTVARLGCRLVRVDAVGCRAALAVLAPLHVAHRLVPCLGQLVEVQAVAEAA